jgi:N12 class adenine-specific DNA methylase
MFYRSLEKRRPETEIEGSLAGGYLSQKCSHHGQKRMGLLKELIRYVPGHKYVQWRWVFLSIQECLACLNKTKPKFIVLKSCHQNMQGLEVS